MSNKEIARQLEYLGKLLEVNGDGSFRSKAYSIAAFRVRQLPMELASLPREEMKNLEGIGEVMGNKILELLQTGTLDAIQQVLAETPPGIQELLRIRGLGAKKIHEIWQKLDITTPGELLQACNENRLISLKGFGKKTQENIQKAVDYYLSRRGALLYANAEAALADVSRRLKEMFGVDSQITGEFRRQAVVIQKPFFLINLSAREIAEVFAEQDIPYEKPSPVEFVIQLDEQEVSLLAAKDLPNALFVSTGSQEFIDAFRDLLPDIDSRDYGEERSVFTAAGLPFIPPALRESSGILVRAKEHGIPALIQEHDIRGIIHCHSNWSDGVHTIQEMAEACIEQGYEYLVLSDHSKSAFYAQGLDEHRIKEQHASIDQVNQKLAPFKIFKSIESDILANGSLDYDDNVLSSFDLIIASVHSNLTMSREKATHRILTAVENPYTTILGHMTGRLLLSRPGYEVDHKAVIDACARNRVIIEINANPYRLDMSWEWIPYAIEKDVLLSINPDAHSTHEFSLVKYGVLAAQKGLLTAKSNLSSLSRARFEAFLRARKEKRKG